MTHLHQKRFNELQAQAGEIATTQQTKHSEYSGSYKEGKRLGATTLISTRY